MNTQSPPELKNQLKVEIGGSELSEKFSVNRVCQQGSHYTLFAGCPNIRAPVSLVLRQGTPAVLRQLRLATAVRVQPKRFIAPLSTLFVSLFRKMRAVVVALLCCVVALAAAADSDVLSLSSSTFQPTISSNEHVFVKFFAPYVVSSDAALF